jgi:hypothetical protein
LGAHSNRPNESLQSTASHRKSLLPIPKNAISFSSARTFLRVRYEIQTHRELVYRPLQFQKHSQQFIGADNEPLSVAMRICPRGPEQAGLLIVWQSSDRSD